LKYDRIKWILRNKLWIVFFVLGLLLIAFVGIVIGNIIGLQLVFDPEGLLDALHDREVLGCIGFTLLSSLLATFLAFIFGVPLAYALSRKEFPGKNFLEAMADIPIMIPHVVAGIALFAVFSREGLIGHPLSSLILFRDAMPGTVVAMLFVSFPFIVSSSREGFRSVDPRLERVSRSLGAGEWKTFWRVSFPLAGPHLLAGSIMSWARGISEFAAVSMLAYYPMVASTMIWDKFQSEGLWASMPVTVLLILICMVVFVILRLLSGRMSANEQSKN
jgi:molybdate/tungstate transport system permease protein